MKKLFIISIVFLFVSVRNYAQQYELGKVTIEELQEKVHPIDSSAVAAFLFNKGKVRYDYKEGFSMVTEVEVKVKIYKKEGYQWANEQIPFFVGSSEDETVKFSDAITYNLVNGVVQKSKTKAENEFIEELNKSFNLKKIVMPNVKEGSIIEYKYTIRTPYISSIRDWRFQKKIPVNYSEFTTDIPEYFFYNVYRKGSFTLTEAKSESTKYIGFSENPNSWEYKKKMMNNPYRHDVDQISYFDNRTVYSLKNIPALKEELFVNNINNYAAAIEHELIGIQYPGEIYQNLSNTWEEIVKDINQSEYFGDQLSRKNYFEKDLEELLKGLSSNSEKIASIFKHVQSRMSWNKYLSYYCHEGVKTAYQEKVGNAAEINLMLVAMLRFADFDANPVLLSTRSNGVFIFPSRKAYDVVIASVLVDGNLILMDATSKNSLPGVLPLEDLNWFGRLMKKDGSSETIDIMPKENSSNLLSITAVLDGEGLVIGQLREHYYDYYAMEYRDKNSQLSDEICMETIEKKYKGLEIDNYERINNKVLSEPVIEKYNFKSNNSVEIIGDKMYFSPIFYFGMKENLFKSETREYPVDFNFSTNDKYVINITIPDGYQVESLPIQCSFSMIDQHANFKYTISTIDNKIQGVITLNINSSIIPSDYYDTLKEFFRKVVEKENEKIVLKKK